MASPITQVQPAGTGPESLITQVQAPGHAPPESLITQVQPPGGAASPITQVSQTGATPVSAQPLPPKINPNATSANSTDNMAQVSPATPKSSTIPNIPKQSLWRRILFPIFACCFPELKRMQKEREARIKRAAERERRRVEKAANPATVSTTTTASDQSQSILKTNGTTPQKQVVERALLPPLNPNEPYKKCLVLDLDETLVHSSFKEVEDADFVIPVEIDNMVHSVYVLKRPGVDVFLQRLGSQFEVVIFTASLAKYADPVLDMLDPTRAVKWRLFRESCQMHRGNYVKDLSQLGRDLRHVIILDNSPASYYFHPQNAVPVSSWFSDPNDTELLDLIPFLEDLKKVDDVTQVLDANIDDGVASEEEK